MEEGFELWVHVRCCPHFCKMRDICPQIKLVQSNLTTFKIFLHSKHTSSGFI